MALSRTKLMEDIADRACDVISIKDLLQFYYDSQIEYMESMSEKELLEYAKETYDISEEELEDYEED